MFWHTIGEITNLWQLSIVRVVDFVRWAENDAITAWQRAELKDGSQTRLRLATAGGVPGKATDRSRAGGSREAPLDVGMFSAGLPPARDDQRPVRGGSWTAASTNTIIVSQIVLNRSAIKQLRL